MAIFRDSLVGPLPDLFRAGVCTLGNFDGVHRGHQALLAETVRRALILKAASIAVIFDPHPLQILRPQSFQPLLTDIDDRARLIERYGIDHVLILHTTPELLQLEATEFFTRILCDRLSVRALVEGFNFAFGHDRTGTPDVLRDLCQQRNVGLTMLPAHELTGTPISSSRVRREIQFGSVDVVRTLLGRPYRIVGKVAVGQRRGQSLGFPTANLEKITTLIPGDGVYAASVLHHGQTYRAAVNIGPNPTFGEQAHKVEAHLLDFQGDLYGQQLALEFLAKIRDTRPFGSVQELITQIQADVAMVRQIAI